MTAFITAHRDQFGVEPICRTLLLEIANHEESRSRIVMSVADAFIGL